MHETIQELLVNWGVSSDVAIYIGWLTLLVAVSTIAFIANFVSKRILLSLVSYLVKRSRTQWDDALLHHKVFSRLAHIAPALVFYIAAPVFGSFTSIIERLATVYMFYAALLVVFGFLNATIDIYQSMEMSRNRPLKGFVQVAKIIIAIAVSILALGTLMDQSPVILLSGFGAMTAVILLVFKDSILGLVASVQLSMNDMIRIGDWIEMPKYGADGDVIDITLHTVKVQNWDKTITTIPAYALISDAFKNWRGMSESGGRRIKRSISIDMTQIKLCTPEMLDRYEKFQLIHDYVRTKREELRQYNETNKIDSSELINGRHLTNIGTFRAYVKAYLRSHPEVHSDMTFLIRQLPSGDQGLPLEIYIFSKEQDWVRYEGIQADIFDHLLSILPMFDLRVFQRPTGHDLKRLKLHN